jgi:Leucine-rich repeat (LRR) protein
MRTLIAVISVAVFFNVTFASELQLPSKKNTLRLPDRTTQKKAVSTEDVKVKSLQEAQAWLASINYVKTLEQIPEMKWLRLQMYGSFNGVSTQQLISNENMRHIKVMTKLEELALPRWTTDSGLSNVAGLIHLKNLSISITNITDAGMAYLQNLNSLETVTLHGTKITGEGLKHLQGKNLSLLGLNQTNIGDADMELIGTFTNLKSLALVGTKITDASIPHLKKLKNLQRVDITGTKISQQGKQDLHTAMPGLKIY